MIFKIVQNMPKTTDESEKSPLLWLVVNLVLLNIGTFTCVYLSYRYVYLNNLVSYCSFSMYFALLLFSELKGVKEHSFLSWTQKDFAMRQAQNEATGRRELQSQRSDLTEIWLAHAGSCF